MVHWQGHTDYLLKKKEESRAKEQTHKYEASLSKWFKRRRSLVRYCRRNVLYYLAGASLMRGIEPLTSNVSITDLLYKHVFVGNMILITIAAGLATINLIFNKD